jgi:hypothetical protein
MEVPPNSNGSRPTRRTAPGCRSGSTPRWRSIRCCGPQETELRRRSPADSVERARVSRGLAKRPSVNLDPSTFWTAMFDVATTVAPHGRPSISAISTNDSPDPVRQNQTVDRHPRRPVDDDPPGASRFALAVDDSAVCHLPDLPESSGQPGPFVRRAPVEVRVPRQVDGRPLSNFPW